MFSVRPVWNIGNEKHRNRKKKQYLSVMSSAFLQDLRTQKSSKKDVCMLHRKNAGIRINQENTRLRLMFIFLQNFIGIAHSIGI